ncbi:hypothetical protein PISMIDRAFT_14188 [Pisolithus microcarpus 441]|uniref:Uncharacterized protein n=1 Tax=Pisolithus microcarpus 441 TaxID=765257 RepID=A0A0C9Z8H0_9AGAM|nr:hypothetical protein PISMIDRAFT_14188 [Pisolithus microcarpus 441]
MTVTERHALEALRDPVSNDSVNEPTDDDHETDGYGAMVLDGTEQLDEQEKQSGAVWQCYWQRQVSETRVELIEAELPMSQASEGTANGVGRHVESRIGVGSDLLRCLIPCSPITPKVAITVSALNLYHTARQCCPHLLIQAYVKSLCDMHGVPFYNHRSHQFSIALDVYLQILALVSNLDEPAMRFKMLFAQDGNDSLKRVATRVLDGNLDDTDQLATSLPTLEHAFHHEQYLTRKFVEKFASD